MARALLIVLDSVGCGGATDAVAYGDAGSDTLGHIAEACAEGKKILPGKALAAWCRQQFLGVKRGEGARPLRPRSKFEPSATRGMDARSGIIGKNAHGEIAQNQYRIGAH